MAEAITPDEKVIPDGKIEVRVISPTDAKNLYKLKKDVDMAIMRCVTGDLAVLPGRLPVSMVLGTGVLRIFDEGEELHMAVSGGIASVGDNIVTILSNDAYRPEEIDTDAVTAKMNEYQRLMDETENLHKKGEYREDIHRCKVQLEVAKTVPSR